MDILLGLISLGCLSLFLTRALNKSSALMPLLAVSIASLWFFIWGIFNLLPVAGYSWYIACLGCGLYVAVKEKKQVLKLLSPGFVFFMAGGLFFCLLFFFTKPMLSHWDEFTFWGTAAKAVSESNQLYTIAQSNLVHRSYPPGLILQSYMMQFFSAGFQEYKFYAAYAVLSLACLSTVAALFGKNRAGGAAMLCSMLFLPFLFETMLPAGQVSTSYIYCLADPALAMYFGGALCFYFAGGTDRSGNKQRDTAFFISFIIILAALVNIKDIGFALALICLFVAAADLLFCQKGKMSLFGLKGFKVWLIFCALAAAVVVMAYYFWALHISSATGTDRFDLGNEQGEKNMFGLLLVAAKAFLGIEASEKFIHVRGEMWRALFDPQRPVSLFGPSIRMIIFIMLLVFMLWFLSVSKQERKQALVFAISGFIGFVLFYLFNIFTYTYIFSDLEGNALKEYRRYIYPYFAGWLMCTAALLGSRADRERLSVPGKYTRARVNTARLVSLSLALVLILTPAYYGRLSDNTSNFLHISPSLYTGRQDVKRLVADAKSEGMDDSDTVYLISQDDDGSRYYMLCYEMKARLPLLYNKRTNSRGETVFAGESAASLSPVDINKYGTLPYPVECSPEDLTAYLKYVEADHILLDSLSPYILEDFEHMFVGGLNGWTRDGWHSGGPRYYEIVWDGDSCEFVPSITGGAQ